MSNLQSLPRLRGVASATLHRLHPIQAPFLRLSLLKRPYSFSTSSNSQTPIQKQRKSRFKPSDPLSGRTCMITGATSGIGYAIADRFLQEGVDKIILVGRSQQRLVDAAARLGVLLEGVETGNGRDEILATRAPEEDQQEYADIGLSESQRVSLFVGDVSEPGPWVRELEEKMVGRLLLSRGNERWSTNVSIERRRRPRQRRRNIHVEYPR